MLFISVLVNRGDTNTVVEPFVNPPINLSWIGGTDYNNTVFRGISCFRLSRRANALKKMTSDNKRYIIRFQYDLKGDTLRLGKNCCLDFRGGQLLNGVVIGKNSKIKYNSTPVFNSVHIQGTWDVPLIKTSMFADAKKENVLIQLFNLTNEHNYNKVVIEAGDYLIRANVNNDGILRPKSNTEIVLEGIITLLPTEYQDYQIMSIYGAENVYLHGKGQIKGDLYEHNYEKIRGTHEWGHGLTIRGCKNVLVEGITVKNCTGDACSVGAQAYGDLEKAVPTGVPSINVELKNCRFESSRRQGLTITFASYVTVNNCVFDGIYNTYKGTPPGAAIDIEPDNTGTVEYDRGSEVYHIIIMNTSFHNCRQGIVSWKSLDSNDTRWFRDLQINNCTFTGIDENCLNITGFDDVRVRNITKIDSNKKDRFYKCKNVDYPD